VTREPRKNTAASIRARLLSLAQSKGEDYQRVLGRYAIERFLYRLGRSPYRDKFALKGATLFTLWTGHTHRPTKDLDLLGQYTEVKPLDRVWKPTSCGHRQAADRSLACVYPNARSG